MRELKFRAWDRITNRMSDGFGLLDQPLWFRINTNRHPIMQYTGLKDKNGKEIYEGDIVKYDSHYIGDRRIESNSGKIIYGDGSYWIDYETSPAPDFCETEVRNCRIEIIGNMYENVELMEAV